MLNKCILAVVLSLNMLIFSLSGGGIADIDPASSETKASDQVLSFAFGSSEPADGYTQVTDILYTEELGYGFLKTDILTVNDDNVSGRRAFRFKVDVPDGNYTVKVDTTAETMTSEVVESVPAKTGITKTGDTFDVAVCDGVLDLTFPAEASVKTIEISQTPPIDKREKPYVFAIGDSTTKNNADGAFSWGNCVESGKVDLPNIFGGFANHGMAGRNSVSFYNQGRVEAVLLAICPGDYVTVNMGINSENDEADSYYDLMRSYYVEGILQRGGIPVIVTATPDGPVGNRTKTNYDDATGKFTNSRGDTVRNNTLRKIAEEKDLVLIELGQWAQNWMNTLTVDDVAAYNEANDTAYTTVLEMVQSWYIDHNHYKEYLGIQIGNYLLGELSKIAQGIELDPVPEATPTLQPAETADPNTEANASSADSTFEMPAERLTDDTKGDISSDTEVQPEKDAAAAGNFAMWIIVAALVVVLVGMAAVRFIMHKKEKKE